MTDNQENKLSMGLAVQTVVNNNNSIWSGLPAFVTAFGDYETVIQEIQNNRVVQEADTSGVTLDKHSAEAALIEKTLAVSSGTYAYATAVNNNTLRKKIAFSPSSLSRSRDTVLRDICQLVHSEVNAVIANLADYGILPADLTDLQNKIDAYNSVIAEPREAITDKSTATQELVLLFKKFDGIINDMLDKLMVNFKSSDPNFHRQYTNARIIVDLGVRHEGEPEETEDVPPVD